MTGRYDASYGLFLEGTKKGFIPIPAVQSGFILNGDVKSMRIIKTSQGKKIVIAAVNDDSLRAFQINAR